MRSENSSMSMESYCMSFNSWMMADASSIDTNEWDKLSGDVFSSSEEEGKASRATEGTRSSVVSQVEGVTTEAELKKKKEPLRRKQKKCTTLAVYTSAEQLLYKNLELGCSLEDPMTLVHEQSGRAEFGVYSYWRAPQENTPISIKGWRRKLNQAYKAPPQTSASSSPSSNILYNRNHSLSTVKNRSKTTKASAWLNMEPQSPSSKTTKAATKMDTIMTSNWLNLEKKRSECKAAAVKTTSSPKKQKSMDTTNSSMMWLNKTEKEEIKKSPKKEEKTVIVEAAISQPKSEQETKMMKEAKDQSEKRNQMERNKERKTKRATRGLEAEEDLFPSTKHYLQLDPQLKANMELEEIMRTLLETPERDADDVTQLLYDSREAEEEEDPSWVAPVVNTKTSVSDWLNYYTMSAENCTTLSVYSSSEHFFGITVAAPRSVLMNEFLGTEGKKEHATVVSVAPATDSKTCSNAAAMNEGHCLPTYEEWLATKKMNESGGNCIMSARIEEEEDTKSEESCIYSAPKDKMRSAPKSENVCSSSPLYASSLARLMSYSLTVGSSLRLRSSSHIYAILDAPRSIVQTYSSTTNDETEDMEEKKDEGRNPKPEQVVYSVFSMIMCSVVVLFKDMHGVCKDIQSRQSFLKQLEDERTSTIHLPCSLSMKRPF